MKDQDNSAEHTTSSIQLSEHWQVWQCSPMLSFREGLALGDNAEFKASVPCTVGMLIDELTRSATDLDDCDWYFSCQFSAPPADKNELVSLDFSGLATICEVWLNDQKILDTQNMFRQYSVNIGNNLQQSNHLTLRFRSLSHLLKSQKRARPRWKTKLTEDQQMRWFRTTPLGYIAAWTPPVKCIGPWREISLRREEILAKKELSVVTEFKDDKGRIKLDAKFKLLKQVNVLGAELLIAGQSVNIPLDTDADVLYLKAQAALDSISTWWPHTHGEPSLYPCELRVKTDESVFSFDLGELGFKSVNFEPTTSTLSVNQKVIFCRGVCWSGSDFYSLNAPKPQLEKQLTLLKAAGVNMIRIGGTMVYETDYFYQLCDRLGLMVWQDFMFASMDYPLNDEDFHAEACAEVEEQINRLAGHVCISTYCGNTDIKAQAAMFGFPESDWSHPFFEQTIPGLCESIHPGIPYFASSPEGGALPFHLQQGISHYWGIGAYKRPINDDNIQRVKFASEGMGHSHIPVEQSIVEWIGNKRQPVFDAEWLSRIPKDLGAGWDFDQIRDDYLAQLFRVDPLHLRRTNPLRYLEMSRVVSGEVMANVFRQWRTQKSQCQGGLTWFARDFWPCAGFGLIDSFDRPKPAYYILKRAWSNRAVLLNNLGLDGCGITLVNEPDESLAATLVLSLYGTSGQLIHQSDHPIDLKPGETQDHSADALIGTFFDTGYHYQFGEPAFRILACQLINQDSEEIASDYFFCDGHQTAAPNADSVSAVLEANDEQSFWLTISSDTFLQYVAIDVKDVVPEDNYFHLPPNQEKRILLRRAKPGDSPIRGKLSALNLNNSVRIK